MEKPLFIIPARGGSKGIPGKNIADLDGKPLIAWSIQFALNNLGGDGAVYVSTDSSQIAELSKQFGSDVIIRPSEISDDLALTEDALKHAVSSIQDSYSHLVLLQCTSPFRSKDLYKNGMDLLRSNPKIDSALTTRCIEQFQWKLIPESNHISPTYDLLKRPMRQQRKPEDFVWVETGNMYIITMDCFLHTGCRVNGDLACSLETSIYEAHEIDEPCDLDVARVYASLPNVQHTYNPWVTK